MKNIKNWVLDLKKGMETQAELEGFQLSWEGNDFDLVQMAREKKKDYRGIIGYVLENQPDKQGGWSPLQEIYPCVNIIHAPQVQDFHLVGSEDTTGIGALVHHLREEGYRRLGFFGTDGVETSLTRCEAFLKSCLKEGVASRVFYYNGERLTDKGRRGRDLLEGSILCHLKENMDYWSRLKYLPEAFSFVLAHPERPEVLLFENDRMALEFLNHVKTIGLEVPDDISVCGFDGMSFYFNHPSPLRLTTVQQDFYSIGRRAVQVLRRKIDGKAVPRETRVPVKLSLGDTTRRKERPEDLNDDRYFQETVKQYIKHQFHERDLKENLASKFELNPHYFLVKFKRIFEVNFTDYVNQLRIQSAAEELVGSGKTVMEIFTRTGIRSYPYFVKLFKKTFGKSPKQYVKEHSPVKP